MQLPCVNKVLPGLSEIHLLVSLLCNHIKWWSLELENSSVPCPRRFDLPFKGFLYSSFCCGSTFKNKIT